MQLPVNRRKHTDDSGQLNANRLNQIQVSLNNIDGDLYFKCLQTVKFKVKYLSCPFIQTGLVHTMKVYVRFVEEKYDNQLKMRFVIKSVNLHYYIKTT